MDRYQKVKVIGKGAFGAAVLVNARGSNNQYVIKQVDVSRLKPKERDEAKKEIKLLASFHHPNIVRYRDSFVEAGTLNIVMDYAEGGDLHNLIKERRGQPLKEDQVLDYFVQLCLAMKHVHDRKVLHRDIKSQNIFLTQNRRVLKLGDFGIARVLNSTMELARTACGTPYYMSPEICDNQPYNSKSDVWSMGCLLYEMASLKCPFDAKDMRGLVIKILRGAFPPLPRCFSSELTALVGRCLDRQPTRRPTVNELLALPVVRQRIERFLTDAQKQEEFAHTILHRNPSRNHEHPALQDQQQNGQQQAKPVVVVKPNAAAAVPAALAPAAAAARAGPGGPGGPGGGLRERYEEQQRIEAQARAARALAAAEKAAADKARLAAERAAEQRAAAERHKERERERIARERGEAADRRMREEKRAREARERQQREQEAAERRADVANERRAAAMAGAVEHNGGLVDGAAVLSPRRAARQPPTPSRVGVRVKARWWGMAVRGPAMRRP